MLASPLPTVGSSFFNHKAFSRTGPDGPFSFALCQLLDWPACKNLARVRKVVTESPERNPKSSARLSKPTLPGQQGLAEPPKGGAPRSSGQDSLKRTGQTKPKISAMPLKPEWSPKGRNALARRQRSLQLKRTLLRLQRKFS